MHLSLPMSMQSLHAKDQSSKLQPTTINLQHQLSHLLNNIASLIHILFTPHTAASLDLACPLHWHNVTHHSVPFFIITICGKSQHPHRFIQVPSTCTAIARSWSSTPAGYTGATISSSLTFIFMDRY
jgi:hypothetical protein